MSFLLAPFLFLCCRYATHPFTVSISAFYMLCPYVQILFFSFIRSNLRPYALLPAFNAIQCVLVTPRVLHSIISFVSDLRSFAA